MYNQNVSSFLLYFSRINNFRRNFAGTLFTFSYINVDCQIEYNYTKIISYWLIIMVLYYWRPVREFPYYYSWTVIDQCIFTRESMWSIQQKIYFEVCSREVMPYVQKWPYQCTTAHCVGRPSLSITTVNTDIFFSPEIYTWSVGIYSLRS